MDLVRPFALIAAVAFALGFVGQLALAQGATAVQPVAWDLSQRSV